jgi:hypothetical protein
LNKIIQRQRGHLKSCAKVLKLWVWLLSCWGRCFKVTLQTYVLQISAGVDGGQSGASGNYYKTSLKCYVSNWALFNWISSHLSAVFQLPVTGFQKSWTVWKTSDNYKNILFIVKDQKWLFLVLFLQNIFRLLFSIVLNLSPFNWVVFTCRLVLSFLW